MVLYLLRRQSQWGEKVLVIDKGTIVVGNVYIKPIEGINVHIYGVHIFHMNNKVV